MANEILGRMNCPVCDSRAAIYQAKRKGAHLYYRCDGCGLNQGTGSKLQGLIWERAEWLESPPPKPDNLPVTIDHDSGQIVDNETEPATETVTESTDFDPTELTEQVTEPEPKGSRMAAVGAMAVGAGLLVAMIKA